jgi:hypothetical protein
MRLLSFVFLLWLIASCQGSEVKRVDHTIFLHDKSSKVWLIDKKLQGVKDFTPLEFQYREIVVFHKTGNAYFYKLNTFGTRRGYKMTFSLDWEKRTFLLENSSMKRKFKVNSLGRERFVITSNAKDYNYKLVLIPFPEY